MVIPIGKFIGKPCSLDIETTGLDPQRNRILSISMCGTDLEPISVLWDPSVRGDLQRIANNPRTTLITQNGPFDYSYLVKAGLTFRCKREDTFVGAHVLEPNERAGLQYLVRRYLTKEVMEAAGLGHIKIDYHWKEKGPESWIKANKKWFKKVHGREPNMSDCPAWLVHSYARKDALYTLLIYYVMKNALNGSVKFVYRLDMDMIPIVVGMKLRGIPLDIKFCRDNLKILRKSQRQFLKTYQIEKVGPLALKNIIFPKLGIKLTYKTPKGNYKLDEQTLRRYQVKYPEHSDTIEKIIQYRKAKQSDSTYFASYLSHVKHGKIFPTFHISKARTGRFSSSDPNLQNVKKDGEVRDAFLVRSGFMDIHWDYDACELRILAHYSEEPNLVEIFRKGIDPHARTAELMGIDKESVKHFLSSKFRDQEPRFVGKQLNFSFWYGMGIDKFCLDMGIARKIGEDLYARYKRAYPDAVNWSRRIISQVKGKGYIEDIFGRIYKPICYGAEYKVVNYIIQGTAGGVLKIGMQKVENSLWLPEYREKHIRAFRIDRMRGIMYLTLHDEIGVEVPDKKEIVEPLIKRVTEDLTFKGMLIPLTVSPKWTRTSWGKLQKLSKVPITF